MAHMHDRLQAYYDTLKKHDIPVDPRLVKQVPYGYVREAALEEIEDFFSGDGKESDAVFFLTNYLGVLGIETTKKMNIHIPEDKAMLCFDDNDIFRLYTPTISVIRQPICEIGQQAMTALIERLRHTGADAPLENAPVKLSAELVPRDSI